MKPNPVAIASKACENTLRKARSRRFRPDPRKNTGSCFHGAVIYLLLPCLIFIFEINPNFAAQNGPAVNPPEIFQVITFTDGSLCVITGDEKGVFHSPDGGVSWKQARGIPDASLYRVSPAPDGKIFLTTAEGIYRSRDDGVYWHKISSLNAAYVVFNTRGDHCIVKIWGKGLFIAPGGFFTTTRLAGQEEDPRPDGIPETFVPIRSLGDYPVQTVLWAGPGGIYAGSFGKGVYVSRDRGRIWTELNTGLENRFVITLAKGPGGTIFAGTYGGGLYRLVPEVSRWERVPLGSDGGEPEIVQDIAFLAGGGLAAATRENGIIIVNDPDSGGVFTSSPALAGTNIQSVAVGPGGDIYAGAYDKGLFLSKNRGADWRYLHFAYLSHVNRIAMGEKGSWYISVKGLGVLRSVDRGKSWEIIQLPFPFQPGISLAADGGGNLYVGSGNHGLYVSRIGEKPWRKFMDGLPDEGVTSVEKSPDGTLFATSSEGLNLYRLDKEENRWVKIVASEKYGENYTCWGVVFPPHYGAIAYGLQDVMIRDRESNLWERARFGQHFRKIWISGDGRIWTERMLSTFVLGNEREWEMTDALPAERYTSFGWLDETRVAAIRMEGGVDLLEVLDGGLARIGRGLEDQKVLSIAADKKSQIILAGTRDGLWICETPFETWKEVEILRGMTP